MDVHAELEQLLAEQFDAPPDAGRNEKLAVLLRNHPELQAEYLDHFQLHALLQWRGGKANPQPPKVEPKKTQLGGWRSRRGWAAALLLTAASLAAVAIFHSSEAQATPDLVERLIDWNLDLAQVPTRDERNQLYTARAAEWKVSLEKAELQPDDREFAGRPCWKRASG